MTYITNKDLHKQAQVRGLIVGKNANRNTLLAKQKNVFIDGSHCRLGVKSGKYNSMMLLCDNSVIVNTQTHKIECYISSFDKFLTYVHFDHNQMPIANDGYKFGNFVAVVNEVVVATLSWKNIYDEWMSLTNDRDIKGSQNVRYDINNKSGGFTLVSTKGISRIDVNATNKHFTPNEIIGEIVSLKAKPVRLERKMTKAQIALKAKNVKKLEAIRLKKS